MHERDRQTGRARNGNINRNVSDVARKYLSIFISVTCQLLDVNAFYKNHQS